MRAMLPSKEAKSRVTSSRKLRHSSSFFCFSASAAAVAFSSVSSGGGVGRIVALEITSELGLRSRFDIRLKGFSSTFKRRNLCRLSGCQI